MRSTKVFSQKHAAILKTHATRLLDYSVSVLRKKNYQLTSDALTKLEFYIKRPVELGGQGLDYAEGEQFVGNNAFTSNQDTKDRFKLILRKAIEHGLQTQQAKTITVSDIDRMFMELCKCHPFCIYVNTL